MTEQPSSWTRTFLIVFIIWTLCTIVFNKSIDAWRISGHWWPDQTVAVLLIQWVKHTMRPQNRNNWLWRRYFSWGEEIISSWCLLLSMVFEKICIYVWGLVWGKIYFLCFPFLLLFRFVQILPTWLFRFDNFIWLSWRMIT